MRFVYPLIFLMALSVSGTSFVPIAGALSKNTIPTIEYGKVSMIDNEGSILFAGDIMLGRLVEEYMKGDATFPFVGIEEEVRQNTIAVANFEAPVPLVHKKTPLNGMVFSVPESALKEVKRIGFDVLSLANNHSLDYGEEGFLHTMRACVDADLVCIGHPIHPTDASISIIDVGKQKIGILALHTLYKEPSTTTIAILLEKLKASSDTQFVFIHWGEEYKPTHTPAQERLAHFLIDEGVDAIIGHHPHVVEDIELYKGKPIFYSLGNLIFDQYFSEEVQKGYMIKAFVNARTITYTLMPYNSLTTRLQPQFEEGEAREKTLKSLLPRTAFSESEIENGSFHAPAI